MPTLNHKLLLRLVALVVVLGGGLVVLHHVQAGRVPEAILWQANAATEKGKPDKAIFYLKQYLEFRPDDHDVAVRLADLMLDRAASAKDVQNALFILERVLRESPQRADVARKLIALCIRMKRYGDALEHAQRLLETDKADGVVHAEVAECLAAQDRPDEAKSEYEQAITLAPAHVPAYEQLADLLERHFKKPQEAGAVLDRLTTANPTRPEAFLARARFLQRDGKLDECMRALDRVFLLDPENGEALVIAAEVHQARGELRQAQETLRDAIAAYPRYAQGYRALSWLELTGGNEADALATLERGIAVLPDAPELLTPLADLWIERGDLDRARDIVAKLETLHRAAPAEGKRPFALRGGYLRGRLLMKEAKWNEALAELEAVRTDAVGMPALNAQVNLLVAACQEHRGDRDAQVEALRRALAADPTHLAARVALANALLDAGRMEDAIKEYQAAARSPVAGLGVRLTLLGLRIAWARTSDAADDEWKAIGDSLAKLRKENPQAVEPIVLQAELRAARGDFAGAEKLLRAETVARPSDPRLWVALAEVVNRGRGTLAAAEVVSQGQLAAGDSAELRLERARIWADDIQPGREGRLAQLEELPSAGDAEPARLLTGLADIYAAIHDDAGRMRVLAQLAERSPADIGSRRSLYSMALRTGDAATVARWRQELKRIEGPTGKSAAILDALHKARKGPASDGEMSEWNDLAQAVLAATPDRADAHLLLATVADQRHDATEAAKHFETAVDLDPAAPEYQEARLAHYLRTAQDEMARRTLVRLESDPRLTPQRFRAIVEGAIREAGPEAMPRCLSWLTAQCKREPRSALWAGRMLEGAGKTSEAVAIYRQVTESCPAFADGWSARLLAAARTGEAELNETMALAAKALDHPTLFAVCAECGAAFRAKVPSWSPPVNSAADRRAYAEACLAACEARGRVQDAIPILTVIANDKESAPDAAAWARRTLAVLAAAVGAPDKKHEAVDALRDSGAAATVAEARSRLAALPAALRTTTGDDRLSVARAMIGLLATITKDASATSSEWYQLAQLDGLTGDRAGVQTCLRELNRREPNNLFYLALTVDELLADGKLDEARPLAVRLKAGISDVRVLAAATRFHTLANEPDAVLSLIDQFVRSADPGSADGATRQRQAAEVLDRLARIALEKKLPASPRLLDAACERYRASLRGFPEAIVPMAALMVSAGRVQPAFDELERQRAHLAATTLATAGVEVARSGRATPKQVQTVRSWIEAALAANPGSVSLKLGLAELLAGQGDFTAAEPIYRDVLKDDPKNLWALSNLAWILAARPAAAAEALELVERAIAVGGANPEILDTRSRILIAAGQVDRAVTELTASTGPGGTLRLFHLALAYDRLGKHDEARKAFRAAQANGLDPRAIHPDDAAAYRAMVSRAERSQ